MDGGTIALVPSRRLASLLAEARRADDLSLEDLADRSAGRFTTADLLALEGAVHPLDEDTVVAVVALYGIDPGVLNPERSRLVIDLDHRRLRAGTHEQHLGAPTADEVLTTYLSLVYTMRHTTPGTPVPLRDADISVLSRALELATTDVETRLVDLMADPDDRVGVRHRWLRRRVLVPAAGILVAVTALGAVVLVGGGADDPAPVGSGAELIPPIVMERNPDGSPGPQVPIVVEVGDAVVMERNPDGTPGSQVPRP